MFRHVGSRLLTNAPVTWKWVAILLLVRQKCNVLNNVRITTNAIVGLLIIVEFEAAKSVFERKRFM